MPPAWKRHALLGWSCLLSALVLLPLMAPGYVLHLDMVFVPQQTLLPWNLGIGGGLPRSVPQDALVSLVAGPLPGQVLQKAVLVATLVLAGIGAGRLAGGPRLQQVAAASLYLWSAYLAGRLLLGHWGLLWAYAVLPWAVLAARRARNTGNVWRTTFLCGVGALVPTGGLVLALAALPVALGPGSKVSARMRLAAVGLVALFNAPWWLSAIRSPVSAVSDPVGLTVFGARADGPGGVLGSVLAGGGVWNSQATLGSRTTWFALAAAIAVVVLAVIGWRSRVREYAPEMVWLSVLGVGGLFWAWLSGVAGDQEWARSVVSGVPGGGLLRDGQKWTVFWVLLLAVTAPTGLARVTRGADRSLRVFLAVALALLPLAALPDLTWGGFGRLRTAQYPVAWQDLRTTLAQRQVPGDVLSLPWSAFRRYAWNNSDVVLDPLPRQLTRTVVWNDRLPVTVEGRLAEVGGDDPRAELVSRAIESGAALGPVLSDLGVKWVVVQTDQPAASRPPDLSGIPVVWEGPGLELREIPGEVRPVNPTDPLLVAVDLAALGALIAVGLLAHVTRRDRPGVTSQ
ncbi:MAG: hypothetical protein H6528_01450 [Actinobacteria bacterium]|nr:hypothetical protein [Actinomycetota bacterium]MCB8995953.1 hypothetical protein [Actinomycetota bacterium]MCB9424156.1 hypothetical protein [Actinomycetota bacterium]HRY08873.1 hypothetical protein [Candidatus Nanopelagicales bacterium]